MRMENRYYLSVLSKIHHMHKLVETNTALQYAARKPELCKFLIECGLDVDHVAPLDSEPSSGNST